IPATRSRRAAPWSPRASRRAVVASAWSRGGPRPGTSTASSCCVSSARTSWRSEERVERGPMTGNRYLDDDRLALQAAARRFALEEVLPVANACDPEKADIPDGLLRRIGEMGYFGIMIDAEYGGMGKGVFEYALITEELARAWMSVASIIARGNGLG